MPEQTQSDVNPPTGTRRLLILLAGEQMRSAGNILRLQDTNDTGRDDVIGKLLNSGGTGITKYATGDVRGLDQNLKVIADGIYEYLGLTPPEE